MKTDFILPEEARQIFDRFHREKFQIYLVGGAVRDVLLKREVYDCDFTTNATPQEIQSLFTKTIYNNTYGTVSIIPSDNQKIEITPFRSDHGYADHRHPSKITWAKTLKEDLGRRDFTINAIAYDGKHIIDPYNGTLDLKSNLIRAVGDPDQRFIEDGLRLMRAVRFASQLGFLIEPETSQSIQKNAVLIKHVSWERIRDELIKILSSNHPGDGILFLRNTGLLKYILPEVNACFVIEQKSPQRHHIYDVGTHLVKSLDACVSTNAITRMAVLLHDIGKAQTYQKDKESGLITFYNHEIVGAQQTAEIAKRLKLSRQEQNTLVTLVRYHMFTVSEKQTSKAVKRFIRNVGIENIDEAISLRIADRIGSGATETSWRTELFKKRLIEVQLEPFSIKDLKITGTDVMDILHIKPGPKVGQILQEIFKQVDKGILKNETKALIKAIEDQKFVQ